MDHETTTNIEANPAEQTQEGEDNYHDDGDFCSVAPASTGEILISTSHATTDGAPGDQEAMPQSFKGESGQPGGCLPRRFARMLQQKTTEIQCFFATSRVVGLTRGILLVRRLPPGFLTLITNLVPILLSHSCVALVGLPALRHRFLTLFSF